MNPLPIFIHWAELYLILLHWAELYLIVIPWVELFWNLILLAALFTLLIHWDAIYLNTLSRAIPYLHTLSRSKPYLITLSRTIPHLITLSRIHSDATASQFQVLRHPSRQSIRIEYYKTRELLAKGRGSFSALGLTRLARAYLNTKGAQPPSPLDQLSSLLLTPDATTHHAQWRCS